MGGADVVVFGGGEGAASSLVSVKGWRLTSFQRLDGFLIFLKDCGVVELSAVKGVVVVSGPASVVIT